MENKINKCVDKWGKSVSPIEADSFRVEFDELKESLRKVIEDELVKFSNEYNNEKFTKALYIKLKSRLLGDKP